MGMKIFVAGGTGVLGRASVRALVEAGHHVRSTARSKEKSGLVRRLGAEPVELDLYDSKAVCRAIAGSDAVLRLTTKFGPMAKLRDPRTWTETMRLRTKGARTLVDAAIVAGVPVCGELLILAELAIRHTQAAGRRQNLQGQRARRD
jgi:uncharacterized protein YbjT (DUF2867 family)